MTQNTAQVLSRSMGKQSGDSALPQRTILAPKSCSRSPLDSEDPSPVAYLRRLFGLSSGGQHILIGRHLHSPWAKPSQENIDAYSLDAVKAIRDRNISKLREMIEEGTSLNACNRFGESLMHMACRRGDEEIVRLLLLEGNVRLDLRDDFGRTPLHDACWTSKPNFVVLDLLLKVCPPELLLAEDVRGHTPFHYARREHWDGWLDFLKERQDKLLAMISSHALVVG